MIESRAFRLLLACLPYVLAVLVYAPSFANGFLWDDHPLIERNGLVHDLSRVKELITHDFWHIPEIGAADLEFSGKYYRPVVTVAFAIQATLFDLNPAGFHFVSLLLHLACCALVYRALVLRLGGDPNTRSVAASLGTMLFAIHPTRPEVVGWISGATDLWMTFWALVALNVWTSHRHRIAGLLLVMVASGLALLSKESAIVLPFALAADAWLLSKQPGELRRDLQRAAAVLGSVFAVIGFRLSLLPMPRTGVFDEGLRALVLRVLASVGEYMIAIAWHVPGTVQMAEARYDARGQVFPTASLVIGASTLLAMAAIAVFALRKRSLRPWLADVIWFGFFLAPVANIAPLGMKVLVAARFLYAPLFGVISLLTRAIHALTVPTRRALFAGAAAGTIAISTFFGFSSIRQLDAFYNDETLWEYEYSVNRQNSYVLGQLLSIHGRRGDRQRVDELLQDLQKLSASGVWPPMQLIDFFRQTTGALNSTATLSELDMLKDIARAYDQLFESGSTSLQARGLSLKVTLPMSIIQYSMVKSPSFRLAHALMHARATNIERSSELLGELVRANPRNGNAWAFLARNEAMLGKWAEAEDAVGHAERTGVPATEIARLRGAIAEAKAQMSQDDGNEYVKRALAYRALGIAQMVYSTAQAGLREHPGDPNLVAMLVELELGDLRPDAATEWLRTAREAEPNQEGLWRDLETRIAAAKQRLASNP